MRKKQYRHTMRGGNYAKDVTKYQLDGTPIKSPNTITVNVPGYGTMSGSAYMNLMESIDRNGADII